MDDKNIIKQLIEMNSREEILHFLTKNNIDINDEKFKFFMNKFQSIKGEEEYILENVSGGENTKNSSYINALKLTGCLFLAVGGGFALGNLYGKSKNKREVALFNQVRNYFRNISTYRGKPQDVDKLWEQVHRNMATLAEATLHEINNPQIYEIFMEMFSQSPEDIIKANNG